MNAFYDMGKASLADCLFTGLKTILNMDGSFIRMHIQMLL